MPKTGITSLFRPRGRKYIEDQPQQQQPATAISAGASEELKASHSEVQLIRTLEFVSKQPPNRHAAATFRKGHRSSENNSNSNPIISLNETISSAFSEMDAFDKIATTTGDTLLTTTAGSAETAPIATSTVPSITTPEITANSDQSIPEEIEEPSAEHLGEDTVDGVAGFNPTSPDISGQGQSTHLAKAIVVKDALQNEQLSRSSCKVELAKLDAKFEIDDDQLSGGQLAQHFMLDDDEEDDHEDEFDVSLPIHANSDVSQNEDRNTNHDPAVQHTVTYSRQEGNDSHHLVEVQPESLTNQSTANDVSDFMDDDKLNEGIEESSPGGAQAEPLDDEAPKRSSNDSENSTKRPTKKGTNVLSAASGKDSKKVLSQKRKSVPYDTSSDHSEKDHSIEEIIESNQSVEMTLDDRDLSSLHISFDMQDDTYVNQLLADTLTRTPAKQNPEETLLDKTLQPSSGKSLSFSEKTENKTAEVLEMNHLKGGSEPNQKLKSLDLKDFCADYQQENGTKSRNVSPEIEPPIKGLRISDFDLANLTSSSLFDALEKQHQAAKRLTNTSPDAPLNSALGLDRSIDCEDDEDQGLEFMKLRIMALKQEQIQHRTTNEANTPVEQVETAGSPSRPMERISVSEFNKDVLDDITEESEKNSLSTVDEQQTLSVEKTVSDAARGNDTSAHTLEPRDAVGTDVQQTLEHRIVDLQHLLASKDDCLALLNIQLEAAQRSRDSNGGSCEQQVSSGRDSSSVITNSTEYRTFQDDLVGGPIADFYMELTRRDELIAKLTESLQQSVNVRETLQAESEGLNSEVQQLRKQLTEAMDAMRKPTWPSNPQGNCAQRNAVMPVDVNSGSDDDEVGRQFPMRDPHEPDLFVSRLSEDFHREQKIVYSPALALSNQMENFQKYLRPSEVHLFFMVQKKFDDFMSQELEKCKTKHDLELRLLVEKLEGEKQEQAADIKRLVQQCLERDELHSREMEDLRKYFEYKCADLEKQYSDEIFSQKSQRLDADSSSQGSDQEQLPEETVPTKATARLKDSSPRKRTRAELLLSPSHRQMTPSGDAKDDLANHATELKDLKSFYQNKIRELQRDYDENLRKLSERVKYFENRYPEDEYMTLLAETTADDHHWPPELILLREKFTAKSQLEIAQLKIKHEEEMSRIKMEYEKQLNRKNKRHSTFDLARDFDQLIGERDGLRELSKTFRHVLAELAKCVLNCEDDLNATFVDEMRKLLANRSLEELDSHDLELHLNNTSLNSTLLSSSKRYVPDVHGLLEVIEDPNLKDFVSNKTGGDLEDFDLNDCLEKLKSEASYLLQLSEQIVQKRKRQSSSSSGGEKNDSCCEAEDELKVMLQQPTHKFIRTNSLNEQQPLAWQMSKPQQVLNSLPPDLNRLQQGDGAFSTPGNASELNFQVHELKNRLIKSEADRAKLQQELEHTIKRNAELFTELQTMRDKFARVDSLNRTDYAEGYGLGSSMKSPHDTADKSSTSFAELQERARNILSTTTQQQNHNATAVLLQMIEDFCREGDKVVEWNRKDRDDLQSQVEQQESQIRELTENLQDANAKRDKFEVELKASIDKIFVLREIISELETQVETKTLNEDVLEEKVKELEAFVSSQSGANDMLQQEIQRLKAEIEDEYKRHIRQLEEKLQNIRPSAEQSMVLDQLVEQLRDIENNLDQKIKTLESLHNTSNSCSLILTEDVSAYDLPRPVVQQTDTDPMAPLGSPLHPSPRQHSLSMEGVQRIVDKLCKHTRVEEATIKRIHDLEMQISRMKSFCMELQEERDSLQERMSEQMQRIAALQSRLEEQRQRAEELQRAGTTDLNIRIHDLQNEVQNLRETLSSRDKQIVNLRQQLEESKIVIDRLEDELAAEQHPDRSIVERLESELNQRNSEMKVLKDKIKSEMANRIALPDLMGTMLADKNEEIDHLKRQLEAKECLLQELQSSLCSSMGARKAGAIAAKDETSTKLSARTLSDILSISEFDEPDVIRRAATAKQDTPLLLSGGGVGGFMQQTMETSKEVVANLTHKRTEELEVFTQLRPSNTFDNPPHYFQDPHVLPASSQSGSSRNFTPPLVPRQINFSALTDDSKGKSPSCLTVTTDQRASLEGNKEPKTLRHDLLATQQRLAGLQGELRSKEAEFMQLESENLKLKKDLEEINEKCLEIEHLLERVSALTDERNAQSDALHKQEKELVNYKRNEEQYLQRLAEQEEKIAKNTRELTDLSHELQVLKSEHAQCKETLETHSKCKERLNALNIQIRAKDERLLMLTTKLSMSEDALRQLQKRASSMDQEIEMLRSQQLSDNSSRQLSVDEIAQQLEKELNYSAQLDSNILKAIESEGGTNQKNVRKRESPAKENGVPCISEQHKATDNENFTGERELLNQLEALRVQIAVEREQAAVMRQKLQAEKQHSQDIQEQDVLIIEAMRVRLEKALAQEDELHKQLDQEREKCERLQTQLTVLQRSDSRRNISMLKSPTDSPRRSPRGVDFDSELAERLRSEIKLLTSQQERERERNADLQHSLERERARFETELQDRINYSERLKQEMERLARDKELSEVEAEHLHERLTLQSQEIESLEARIATLQEAETRRVKRRDQQLQENAQNAAELQELRAKLDALEAERDNLLQTITLLRLDLERSASQEAKLAEALAQVNAFRDTGSNGCDGSIPQQFLQKMKDINILLAENTKENRQMAETVQFLVEERRQLQRKCEELEQQLGSNAKVNELEERCNHLLGRYLRVESHRKALVYQKRYLNISLRSYQESEAQALAAMNYGLPEEPRKRTHLFKTVALAVVAIQRMKYIGRIWQTGKRIVSKSVFTITQQKRSQAPTISCAAASSTVHSPCDAPPSTPTNSRFNFLDQRFAPLQAPALLHELSSNALASDFNGRACLCDNSSCGRVGRVHRQLSHTLQNP